MTDRDLWYGTSGPRDAKIVICGESWGAEEAAAHRPFVGTSGTELNRMLAEAGIQRDEVLCTNVVAERPQNNEMWRLFHAKDSASAVPRIGGLHPGPIVHSEVSRLYDQIRAHSRRLVIAAGNYSLWALTACTGAEMLRSSNNRPIPKDLQPYAPNGIMSWRGSMWYMLEDRFAKEYRYGKTPLLPIIHPAAILRAWEGRAITVHDLKSRVPMALRGDWRHNVPPVFWAPPTFSQVRSRLQMWIGLADAGKSIHLAEDIETARGFITCLGLADSVNFAMCIPCIRRTKDGFDSWWTPQQEAEIVQLIRRVNSHPNIKISGQNFIYDTQYIQQHWGVTPHLDFDCMLAQNVMFPGTPKGLDYLSSLYCRYHWYWKEDHKEWDMKGTIEDLLVYNCWDVVRTWECADTQRKLISQLGLDKQFALKMRVNDLCLRMMNRGVRFDSKRKAAMIVELSDALQRTYEELGRIIPQHFVPEGTVAEKNKTPWYRSEKQTKAILHDVLGLPVVRNRKTGKPTSGKEARNELRRKAPEWSGLLNRLGIAESVDNTLGVINSGLDPDGRIRCSFNPGGTETHRLSSSKNAFGRGTNLQNLTKGEEDD